MEELKVQGKTEKELEKAIGLGNGAFTRWKYQNVKSYMKYMDQIADFLNVTSDYLKDTSDSIIVQENMTVSEIKLIRMYRKMEEKERECLMASAELFLEAAEFRKMKEKTGLYSKKYNPNETTKTSGETPETDENLS